LRDLIEIAAATRDIYERNASRFDAERRKTLFERNWLERFCALLPDGAHVLDVGCGAGDPIARYFLEHGYRVTGVDFAEAMLSLARSRYPAALWLHADMRELKIDETFDGIVAWHSFFHLRPDDQRQTLKRFAEHLAPAGVLMLTVGPEAGEATGHVGDDVVYHSSLSPDGYSQVLAELGLRIVAFVPTDEDCGGATVLLAQCVATPDVS
jgi:ubiquinone/menaquinone biosynthesis C-methylase UbiE